MTPKSLTPEHIRRMLILAYQKVADKKDTINSINMFPVPDQDTGDNLTTTLKGVFNAIDNQSFTTITQLRNIAIDGAICNASGNVGIITTGFLNGFLSHLPDKKISPNKFSYAFSCGRTSAYESIQNPKEGTILDVIQAASESFNDLSNQNDFKKIIKKTIKKAKESLDATQQKMDIYKKTKTVDAGGYGFLLILEGFLEGLNGKNHHNINIKQKPSSKETSFFQVISHRYEVISLLESPKVNKMKILSDLTSYGDCLDIVQTDTKIKIHIHTDLPNDVVEMISKYGSVIKTQTTDMTQQVEENNKNKQTLGLIIDSATSLNSDFTLDNDIFIVPFKTKWEKVDQEITDPNISIYQKMRLFEDKTETYGWPKTSQPSSKLYFEAYKEQLHKYNSVICITLSSVLSGSYNSAIQARLLLPPSDQNKIIIPDFRQAGPGQAQLTIETIKLIKQGYTSQQIENKLTKISKQIIAFAAVEKISWLIKGGRFSGNKAKAVSILQKINFNPILELNSKGISLMRIRFGNKNNLLAVKQTLNKISQKYNQNNLPLKLVIQHSCQDDSAQKLKKLLDPKVFQVIQISQFSPVIGVHLGPGIIAAATLPQNI